MNGLSSTVITVCCASLICVVVSNVTADSGTKKILNLVLGAFVICSMIAPVKAAVSEFSLNREQYISSDELTATADEAYQTQVVSQTKRNLEQTLTAILNQNGIAPESAEIILSVSHDNCIIISQISIYINESYLQQESLISELTTQNFGIVPSIIVE